MLKFELPVARTHESRFRVSFVGAALLALGLVCQPAAADEKKLHFPPDRTVGTIKVKPARADGQDLNPFVDHGVEVKPARGDVVVPGGYDVSLDVPPAAAVDLAFLSALAPDDIQQLSINFGNRDVPPLGVISKLLGLRGLRLEFGHLSEGRLAELGMLPHLDWLTLGRPEGDKPAQLVHGVEWLASLPELTSLNLGDWELSDAVIDGLPRCQKLERLSVEIRDLKEQHLRALARIPRLRSLELRRIRLKGELRGINVTGLEKTAAIGASFADFENSAHLETLKLWNFPVNAAMLRGLAKVKTLRSLQAIDGRLEDDAPSALRELKQIRKLELPATDQPVLSRELAKALATLPEVREWPELNWIDEATLDGITRATQVETLDLSASGQTFSRASIARLANLKKLRRLKLSFFPIDDEGLASLAGLKALASLNLWKTNVSGEGFRHLKELPQLEFVVFGIGDEVRPRLEGLVALPHLTRLCLAGDDLRPGDYEPLGRMQNLQYLQILSGLSDDTTAARVSGLKHLDTLFLDESMLTDRGLQSLSQLKNLSRLTVGGVLTDDGVQRLSALPRLQLLDLNAVGVTEAGLEKLRMSNPALRRASCQHPLRLRGVLSIDAQGFWRRGEVEDRKRLDPLEGHPAPTLVVNDLQGSQGRKRTLQELKGKVVLIDFWGVWCGACIHELSNLRSIHDKYRDRGFELIGVHSTEHGSAMSQFAREHKLDWPLVVDLANKTESAYRVKGWPALYLIDRQGILRVAEPHPLQLEEQIERLLAEPVTLGP